LQPTDQELCDRFVRQGDEAAFRVLFRRHSPRLYAIALRMLAGRVADAEDAVQDAWLRAASGLRRFEWRSALSTWLSGIVINCARERLRARPLVQASDADLAALPAAPRPQVPALDLERGLAALPDGYREVLVLHDLYGYTHLEIADLLDIVVGTSKSQLFHARRALRARLSPAMSDER
jgi:RNA polymerase sigma-70 factor (ECF subfamily)